MATIDVGMSSHRQYTDEFTSEAAKQVVERSLTVVDVATRLRVPKHTLYGWSERHATWRARRWWRLFVQRRP